MKTPKYPFTIRELAPDDGGGFLIEFPDLPGCMSDGETVEEAIVNGVDAVQRVPRSLHARLTKQAKREHVSLNTLVVSILSESLGYKSSRQH